MRAGWQDFQMESLRACRFLACWQARLLSPGKTRQRLRGGRNSFSVAAVTAPSSSMLP